MDDFELIPLGSLWYEVNKDGFIKKKKGKGFIKAFPDEDGYLKYALTQPLGTYNIFVHRLVYEMCHGKIPNGKTVDHIDGNKLNNRIENLQLLSAEDNAVKGNAKKWLIISPDDKAYYITNLADFCRKNGLNAGHMSEVARGYRNQTQCKGWRCYYG